MKNVIFSVVAMATIFTACNSNNKKTSEQTTTTETSKVAANNEQLYACSMHPEVIGKKGEKCSKCGMELTEPVKQSSTEKSEVTAPEPVKATTEPIAEKTTTTAAQTPFSINEIVSNYLTLKNALTQDDTKAAGKAGKSLYTTFNALKTNTLDAKQKKAYLEIVETAKENAEHIGDNEGKLDHQREHFASLSKDVNDLVKLFGSKQKLYQDFCPMYDDGKGAIWISEIKDIKNPYYGTKMLTCGSMKKAL